MTVEEPGNACPVVESLIGGGIGGGAQEVLMREENLVAFQILLQRSRLFQHFLHHHVHRLSTFTFPHKMICPRSWFDHHFPALIACPFTSKEVVKVLGSQEYFVSPHHKLQLLIPRIYEGRPHRFNCYVRSVPDPHPHPLAVAGLSRLAKMCKGLGDRPKVVRVDTIEDALPNDVLVEEADEGDGR